MAKKQHEILVGAHTSAAGGVYNALYEGQKIGATTIQLFTANQRQWKSRSLSQEDVEKWEEALAATGLKKIMSHDSYLINLGSCDPDVLGKSRSAFREEIIRCLQLGIDFLNFHPGSATSQSVEQCLETISESLIEVQDLFSKDVKLELVLETTAGQGSSVGSTFEEIKYIISKVESHVPIGVCIDTCHIFAAGYDIRTKDTLDETLDTFDKVIGLDSLLAMHVNDSQKDLGSFVDRHADLGKGKIGMEAFKCIMQHDKLEHVPKYLETPGGPSIWQQEITALKKFASEKA